MQGHLSSGRRQLADLHRHADLGRSAPRVERRPYGGANVSQPPDERHNKQLRTPVARGVCAVGLGFEAFLRANEWVVLAVHLARLPTVLALAIAAPAISHLGLTICIASDVTSAKGITGARLPPSRAR
eukprot:5478719-Prymnesium_polylepis.1